MIKDLVRANVVAIAAAYAKAKGVPLSTVSKRAYGNSVFLNQYSDGLTGLTVAKWSDLMDWFAENWPVGTPWPKTAGIPARPPRKKKRE